MTSTTSIHQEVLHPTLDQHFQNPLSPDNNAHIRQHGSYSDNQDSNTLQPLRDQHHQEPELSLSTTSSTRAHKHDSSLPCCSRSSSRSSSCRTHEPADPPQWDRLHQQHQQRPIQPHLQQQYGTARVLPSTQQDSRLTPGSRSSMEPHILSPSPLRPSPSSPLASSLSPCFPTPRRSVSPSLLSPSSPLLLSHFPCGHGYYCPCLSTPSSSGQAPGVAVDTSSTRLTPFSSNSATTTAARLGFPHSDQPVISTATPPPFPLTPELERQHAAASLTSSPSPPSFPTSPPFPLTASSVSSSKTLQGPHPFPASFFTPSSPPSPSPVSTTTRATATATTHTPVPVATTVTITPTDINCRCLPEKLAFCPHQLPFLLPAANSFQPQASSPPLSNSEIQPLRYFRPEAFNDSNININNSQAVRNNYYNTDTSNDDPSSPFPSDLETQVRNSLDYLRSLETCPPSEQEAIKKSLTKRKKRPKSWIALKDFVSSRILGLHREQDSNNKRQQECPIPSDRPPLLVLQNRNHSTPLLDHPHQRREFLLRSPSPSPSLPTASTLARSAPNSFSRAASRLFFRKKLLHWSEDSQQQQQPPRAGSSITDSSTPSSLQDSHYRHSFGGHDSTHRSMRDWTTTSLASVRAPGSRATSPRPSTFASSPPSPSSSPRSSSPPPHSYIPFQRSPHSDFASKAATFGPSTSFPQLQARFESTASVSSAVSASTSSLSSYSHPPLPQPQSSTSISNYASSSMSSLSTISTTSNVYQMSSPSPSNVSLYSTLPRSPLRKTIAGGQHPLATVSTFESSPTITTETAESVEADTPTTGTQQSGDEQATSALSTPVDSNQVTSEDSVSDVDDVRPDHPKTLLLSAGSQTGSSLQDKKREDLRILKSAVLSGSHNILMLQIKPGTQTMDPDLDTAAGMNDHQDASESDWASVAVTSGDGQPLSPLTASYPVSIHQSAALSSTGSVDTPVSTGSGDTTRAAESPVPTVTTPTTTASPTTETATVDTDPSPLPRHDFEKWTPPPPKPRPTQETHRAQPQAHSRLHFPRLLKQRSFNFPFSTSSSSLSSSTSTSSSSLQQNGSASTSATRASVDGSSQTAGLRENGQDGATRTTSCDIPRPVGPPDPIPLYYQHLQNRQNRRSSSFRRRSHAGELERFSPGWVVVKNNPNQGEQAGGATTPTRVSMSDDQVRTSPSSETHRRRSSATTSRRHASLGVQPNLTSMWGRLLTTILPLGNDHHAQDNESTPTRDREISGAALAMDGDVDPYLQQQRLILTPLSQQQQIHPLYQQQLFFYADEVVSDLRRSEPDPPSFQMVTEDASGSQPRRSMANESLLRADSPSLFPALAHNAHLQGELAQEDGRESLEMGSTEAMVFMRSSSDFSGPGQALVIGGGGEAILAPRSLSADGKIPVSSLALSQPPSYWEAEIKYNGFPKIEPRPEQGNEALPRYTCSVFREGCVNRKTELVGNWRPYRRPWKRTFAHLRGTALRLYAVDMEDVPRLHVRNISLQLAKCEIATDYKQRPNVIRIRACDRTVLIECKDRIDALTWLEHLQAAVNIATSLEDRSMPKFYTLPRAPSQHSQSQSQSQSQQQYGQGQGQGGNRSAASSNARSSIVSNVSNRNYQQTPQPLPQPVPSSSSSTYQQRRASVVPTVTSPRSSIEVDVTSGAGTGADTERRVRRSRSGGILTRSLRTTMTERDRRNEAAAAALGDEAMLRNVLEALGHTPDSGSPSTEEEEEEIDSDNDEDDGQGTDAEAAQATAVEVNQGAAAARRRRSRAGGRRCGGSCHHHHDHGNGHRHHHRGHHYHDHNTTIVVTAGPATTISDVATDGAVSGGRGGLFERRGEDHSDLEAATTHGYQHGRPVTAAAASSAQTTTTTTTSAQRQQRASWNRRLFGGLWGSHQNGQHQQHPLDPSSPDLHHRHTANNLPPLALTAAT